MICSIDPEEAYISEDSNSERKEIFSESLHSRWETNSILSRKSPKSESSDLKSPEENEQFFTALDSPYKGDSSTTGLCNAVQRICCGRNSKKDPLSPVQDEDQVDYYFPDSQLKPESPDDEDDEFYDAPESPIETSPIVFGRSPKENSSDVESPGEDDRECSDAFHPSSKEGRVILFNSNRTYIILLQACSNNFSWVWLYNKLYFLWSKVEQFLVQIFLISTKF